MAVVLKIHKIVLCLGYSHVGCHGGAWADVPEGGEGGAAGYGSWMLGSQCAWLVTRGLSTVSRAEWACHRIQRPGWKQSQGSSFAEAHKHAFRLFSSSIIASYDLTEQGRGWSISQQMQQKHLAPQRLVA